MRLDYLVLDNLEAADLDISSSDLEGFREKMKVFLDLRQV